MKSEVCSTSEARGQVGLCQTLASYTDTMMTASAGRCKRGEENEQQNIIICPQIHPNPNIGLVLNPTTCSAVLKRVQDYLWPDHPFSNNFSCWVIFAISRTGVVSSLKKSLCMTAGRKSRPWEREEGESAVISRATDYN